mmetsp:Transcript_31365/g.89984  ORF Transcript_31365/g.89984 Transcript_31365/m.89984 type:complete len:206 (-) Transcript_31365:97-714(-)
MAGEKGNGEGVVGIMASRSVSANAAWHWISTVALPARAATSAVTRLGGAVPSGQKARYALFISAKSRVMLTRETLHATTLAMDVFTASRSSCRFSRVCLVSFATPPGTSFMVLKSIPCMPLAYTIPLALMPKDRGKPLGSGQSGTLMTSRPGFGTGAGGVEFDVVVDVVVVVVVVVTVAEKSPPPQPLRVAASATKVTRTTGNIC